MGHDGLACSVRTIHGPEQPDCDLLLRHNGIEPGTQHSNMLGRDIIVSHLAGSIAA
jgi:hypothetical protein